jgi:hypothetical protein
MKGRTSFSTREIQCIEIALRDAARVDTCRRRRLLFSLRRHYHFYVSDFVRRGRRLSGDDFERLIAQGVIRVTA